jgi:hypothetical protein
MSEIVNRYFKNWEDRKPPETKEEANWRKAMEKCNKKLFNEMMGGVI